MCGQLSPGAQPEQGSKSLALRSDFRLARNRADACLCGFICGDFSIALAATAPCSSGLVR
ncbi:hypothetical protein ACFXDP_32620 [Streptomyces sp. NPDC059374]|uniref:hypothetical protein n=1 Tax=Streptomyces sp. NPDC059374 TaxID=3346814 RepID=UPI0036830264